MTKFLYAAVLLLGISLFVKTKACPPADKAKAKIVLMKTNRAIGVAHMTVKRTKQFTGNLGKAVKHARFARKQYNAGNFESSIYHSLYARKLAAEVMKANNAKTGSDYLYSADENTFLSASPNEATLAGEVATDNPTELKDEDLMNGNLEIEVQ